MNQESGNIDGPAAHAHDARAGGGGGVTPRSAIDQHYATEPQKFLGKGAIPEPDLADQLGVSRDTLRELRDRTTLGHLWEKDGRRIMWLPEGVAMVSKKLGVAPPEKKEVLISEEFVVAQVPKNPRLVIARTPEGALVRVRVRDNRNFMPGMTLQECRHEQADVWAHSGRCPRWRGRY